MHIPVTRRIRSIVDEPLVHCRRACKYEPRHRTVVPVIKLVMSGRAAHSWLTLRLTFWQIRFSIFFHKFLCIFHNSKTILGIWMDLYRDVGPDDHMWHNSSLLTFLVISLCICVCSITPKLFTIFG